LRHFRGAGHVSNLILELGLNLKSELTANFLAEISRVPKMVSAGASYLNKDKDVWEMTTELAESLRNFWKHSS